MNVRIEISDYDRYFTENIDHLQKTGELKYKNIIAINNSKLPKIIYNESTEFNKLYCINEGIEMIDTRHCGGVIVCFPGDVLVGHYSHQDDFLTRAIEEIMNWLREKIPAPTTIEYIGNDILIDGEKVLGCMQTMIDRKHDFSGFFLAYDNDLITIKNICTKEMKKTPGKLSNYNITPKELLEIVERVCA